MNRRCRQHTDFDLYHFELHIQQSQLGVEVVEEVAGVAGEVEAAGLVGPRH